VASNAAAPALQAGTGDAAVHGNPDGQQIVGIVARERGQVADRRVVPDGAEERRKGVVAVLLEIRGEPFQAAIIAIDGFENHVPSGDGKTKSGTGHTQSIQWRRISRRRAV
jgi:hypothetical protein